MLRPTALSYCLAAVLACSLIGCKKDYEPSPSCYSGTVVASTCMMGVLVDVDPAYHIGARAVSMQGNRFLGNNVVAVANSASLQNLGRPGQRLHFTYTSASAPAPSPVVCCFAADGTTTAVPSVTLSNVSTISCDSVSAK